MISNLSKIRTINTRIRRGKKNPSLELFRNRAKLGGFTTPSGYISKSKAAYTSPLMDRMIGLYEYGLEQEEQFGKFYGLREKINSLIHMYIADSDYYQEMRKSGDNVAVFKDNIHNMIRQQNVDYDQYTEDELSLIDEYLERSFSQKRLLGLGVMKGF